MSSKENPIDPAPELGPAVSGNHPPPANVALSALPRQDLLPGVTAGGVEPMVVCDSRPVVLRARRMTIMRDGAQLVLLVGVDWLFHSWPSTHIPLLSRNDSLIVLGIVNVLTLAHLWAVRAYPKWRARKIASTWCEPERQRTRLP